MMSTEDHASLAPVHRDPGARAFDTGNTRGCPSPSERIELGGWLLDASMPSGTMDLVTLEGFLTALVIGPAASLSEDWLPAVWGSRGPRRRPPFCLRTPSAYARFRALVMRYHGDIARQFHEFPESFQPSFYSAQFGRRTTMVVDPWCIGFVARINLSARAWRPLRRECPALLHPILLYGTRAGWEERHRASDPAAYHAENWPQIAPAVHGIHRYWCVRNRSGTHGVPALS